MVVTDTPGLENHWAKVILSKLAVVLSAVVGRAGTRLKHNKLFGCKIKRTEVSSAKKENPKMSDLIN